MASLQDIRNKLKSLESKKTQKQSDGLNYPFWDIAVGKQATLRFLPDGDQSNVLFWTERQLIKIPFTGIKGQDENKRVVVQVPCVEMWGQTCPIHAELRPMFKDKDLEETARIYWKKRSYFFQGFVRENPLASDTPPQNPIRKFVIGPQLINIIKQALMSPDMEHSPTDYENGTDFRLVKGSKGQYSDYTSSAWSRKESSLTQLERDAINEFGLVNLSSYLPKRPSDADLQASVEMFEASLNGDLYDLERWGNHYKPYGVEWNSGDDEPVEETSAVAVATPSKPVVTAQPAATEAPKPVAAKRSAQEILDSLKKNRA